MTLRKLITNTRHDIYIFVPGPLRTPGAEEIGKDKTGAEFDFQPALLLVGLISANKLRTLRKESHIMPPRALY